MPQSQKRFTVSLAKNLYELLEEWADKEGRAAPNPDFSQSQRKEESKTAKMSIANEFQQF